MDDIEKLLTTDDGQQLRLLVYESSRVPLGHVKWCVDVWYPELEWWYTLEYSQGGWLLGNALSHGQQRLEWWAQNIRYMEW
jgi:hypothetical protein